MGTLTLLGHLLRLRMGDCPSGKNLAVEDAGRKSPSHLEAVMPQTAIKPTFADANLLQRLCETPDAELDKAGFGVIGFDASGAVRRYNRFESECAGLAPSRVLGHHLFMVVAPCMNNFMVAQRFDDAAADSSPLDATIDYVLTLRMRPVKVKLRLLSTPGSAVRYVLVHRLT